MYLYLYDSLLRQRQYERVLSNLETQLIDLGISGKIVRLSSLLSPRQIIQEEQRRTKETKTVVVVGDDAAFTKIIQQAADVPVTFGWVPVGAKTELAERFGLPYGAAAAPILSRRRVAALDVGQFNQYFFIDFCRVPLARISLALNGSMQVTAEAQRMECAIWNMPPTDKKMLPPGYTPSPLDGQLEIVLQPVEKSSLFGKRLAPASIFPFREVRLKLEKPAPAVLDGHIVKENQIFIRLMPQQLKVIVDRTPGEWMSSI
ncbi:hypothetical protein HY065_02405 [Candidatus Berkelbacteria bacterium]|nr:hypothetical protein [Candidatus Berkelbacteria bacterium]